MNALVLRSLATAAALVLVSAGGAAAGGARADVKPSNNSLPSIGGDPSVGSTLTANPGTWDGSAPITFQYQWLVCDASGGACSNITGETDKTYKVRAGDPGNTLRVRVIASNADGSDSAQSAPTAKVTAAGGGTTTSTTTTAPAPGADGCPKAKTASFAVADIQPPARLQFAGVTSNPATITLGVSSIDVRFHVTSTCGSTPVSGAQVYATAVPFGQFSIPQQQATDANGDVTLHFNRLTGFPATRRQQLLVLFLRATKPGDPLLAGISTRQLVSLRVRLRG
ncbi:MAG TPA: hypothetical protein VFB42_05175 [Gaiellaceae bacterium]|nr:hypothetical protein [Gaiellaceae bacterium]